MSPEECQQTWSALEHPNIVGHLEAVEALPMSGLWLAVDRSGVYHYLVQIEDCMNVREIQTKGLEFSVKRHRIRGRADADYIDLAIAEESVLDVFAAVASELTGVLSNASLSDRPEITINTISRWKWFWDVDAEGLAEREVVGLFGELWFLDQWIGVEPGNVEAWGGGDSTRHDFQWEELSVEVKTMQRRSDEGLVHTVQDIDQLANPESGRLYLFSLRIARDRLAANSLSLLVERCAEQLDDRPTARDSFLRKVAERGYSPIDSSLRMRTYRVMDEEIYEVTADFPRLTVESFALGIPIGIGAISYKIDMAACGAWRRDRDVLTGITSERGSL